MSEEKKLAKYLKTDIHVKMLFAWVECARFIMPATTIKSAVMAFKKHFSVADEELDTETAIRYYSRYNEDFIKHG